MEGSCRQNRRAGAARVKYFFSRRIRRDPQVWFRPTLWPCRHGCNERDHRSQGPLVHATGKGWVKEHKQGRHSTSLRRAPCHTIKNAERNCQQFPKLVSSKARAASRRQPRELSTTSPKRSATRVPSVGPHRLYGTASGSARGFAQHHSQQLSRAAVSLWRRAEHQQRCSQHMRVAHSFMTGLNCPIPMTIGWRPDPFGSTVELGSVAMAAQMRTQEIKCFATTFRG